MTPDMTGVIGIGTDLVEIARIEKSIAQFGDKFIDRIYTEAEQKTAALRGDQTRYYAMRFAAKEAAWKALSPNTDSGIGWHDLEISTDDDGRPRLSFLGKAADVFKKMTNGRGSTTISLSDDGGMAIAFVVLLAS